MIRTMLLIAAAATFFSTAALAQTVETFPNTVKYKDTSIANGRGQAGDASLESRTLLNRDGSADVELKANGTITKVQVKAGNDTDNFNSLENDGSVSFRTEGLVRGQTVTIHANVDAGSGTVVVLTEEIVKLRPDLAVSISAPAQVLPDVPITIRATINELNGDVGARANCRLTIDGAEVDRAENIWVDAGGNVQCAFVHTFASYGFANVAVFVDTIDPTDWDDANNSATATVDVARNVSAWTVHALTIAETSESHSTSPLWNTHDVQNSYTQKTDLWAWIYDPVDISSVALAFSASSDGNTLYDYPNPRLSSFRQSPFRTETCASGFGFPSIRICKQPVGNSDSPNGFLLIEISHSVSDAVYHSWGYNWWVNPNNPFGTAPGVYDRITVIDGVQTLIGNTVQWDLRFTDGTGTVWHEQPFLPSLQRTEQSRVDPMRCGFAPRYGFEVCSSFSSSSIRREGFARR